MPPRKKPTAHNGGHVRRTTYGTWSAEYNHDGRRHRTTCKTREEACEWIDLKVDETRLRLEPATPTEMADAAEARRILAGRCSLVEAARLWDRSTGTLLPITLRDAVTEYLALREDDNLRESFLASMRHRLNPLVAIHGDALLHTITADDLRATQRGSAVSRNNMRRYYLMLWRWALRENHTHVNAPASLTVAQADESLPAALGVGEVITLLQVTRDNDAALLPWLCAGLFAGLRVAELGRVNAEHFRGGKLHLDPSITKLRNRRILDLLPNLIAWLEAYPPTGPMLQTNHRKRFETLRKAAQIDPWPNNAARHSFATYHLAAHQDPAKTAHYTRHESQNTLHRHYIDLATHEDGLAYFSLTPSTLDSSAESWHRLGKISAD